jgi:hypothetical protein
MHCDLDRRPSVRKRPQGISPKPYFKRAEGNERFSDDFHGAEGPLGVSMPRGALPICDAFIRAAQEEEEIAFDGDIDHAMLIKLYGASPDSAKGRYSPAESTGIKKNRIEGSPDLAHVSTSFAGEPHGTAFRFTVPTGTRV